MSENCVFCKIIKGEIPSYKIYEDEFTYAFLDIAKDAYGHTLVIPKKHYINILDIPTDEYLRVMEVVKKISEYYVSLGFSGVNVMNASGKSAEQSVFHLHFHIIPRKENDGMHCWPKFNIDEKMNFSEICEKLKLN